MFTVPVEVRVPSRRPTFGSDTSPWPREALPLLSWSVPGPEIPRGYSKASRTLGNHRAGQILARGRVPERNPVTGNPFRLGVGVMAARSPARYGLFACPACYSLLL